MDKQPQAPDSDLGSLAEDARSLMDATADVAGEKISAARKRLAASLESGKKILARAKEKAIEGAKATDEVVQKHPYQAIGIAFGVGALVGFLIARECCRGDD